jgi:peptidoglycan L-alanyl-D-glutamate endopeptidase CwlK
MSKKPKKVSIIKKASIDTLDSVSVQRINTLNPKLITSAMSVFNRARSKGIPLYITWGTRTMGDQQLLHRFGRDIPGKIVTKNKEGYSAHNYGLALDFCLAFDKTLLTWEDVYDRWYWRQRWLKVVFMFEEEGWEAGWRWTNFDPYHVQNLLGNTMFDLTQKYEQAKNRDNGIQVIREQDQDQGVHFQSEEEV